MVVCNKCWHISSNNLRARLATDLLWCPRRAKKLLAHFIEQPECAATIGLQCLPFTQQAYGYKMVNASFESRKLTWGRRAHVNWTRKQWPRLHDGDVSRATPE